MEKLTFRAPAVVGRLRQLESEQLLPDPANDVLHVATQPRREIDLHPAPRSAVPHIPMGYLDIEHFFEAQRLRAQLKVRGGSVPDARLVFDGTDRVAVDFDRIGAAGQSQRLGPEWNGPKHQPPSLTAMLPAIDPAMRPRPSNGMGVVAPDAVAMDERTLTRAVHEVFDGGDRDDGLDVHNRSAPNALVVSAEPLGWKGTARHPAWTPTRVQVCLFSGFQASRSASMPLLSSD